MSDSVAPSSSSPNPKIPSPAPRFTRPPPPAQAPALTPAKRPNMSTVLAMRGPLSPGVSPRTWRSLAEVHARACQAMAEATPTVLGFRLYWSGPSGVGWTDLAVGGAHAIVGRHTECDAHLREDSPLSLRHLLATTVSLSDGPALRLLDLQTATPFTLGDVVARRSLVVSGPVAVGLGDLHVVGAVPIEDTGSGLRLVLDPLPKPRVTELIEEHPASGSVLRSPTLRSAEAAGRVARAVAAAAAADADNAAGRSPYRQLSPRQTHVTSLRPMQSIADIAPRRPSEEGPLPPGVAARLFLRRGHLFAAVDLTERQLETGVLVGRAERCHDEGLRRVLSAGTSRGHVLLLRDHDGVEAFDLCSTQGTYTRGSRVRRLRIDSPEMDIVLGIEDAVTMRLHLS